MAEVKRLLTPVFRGSFAQSVFVKESYDGGEPKHGINAIWDPTKFSKKDKARWDAIHELIDDECLARFKKKADTLPGNYKKGIRDGEEKADLEGFGKGKMFASLSTKMRPGVVDAKRHIIAKDDEEKERLEAEEKEVAEQVGQDAVYSGAYYRATITVYTYDNKGKGYALGLMNLQKVADGERIDGRTDAALDFEDEIDDEWIEQDEEDLDGALD